MGKVISGCIRSTVGITMSAVWDVTLGHTGRTVRGNEAYKFADEWANQLDRDQIIHHPAFEEFSFLVPKTPCVEGELLLGFRGLFKDRQPTSADMGPPPLNADTPTREGRYHRSGEHVLYLADSENGVRRELPARHDGGTPYVQRFSLPLNKLPIADFTKIPADHFVTAVFSKAEECKVAGRGPDSYVFSQHVAEAVAKHFAGMQVPGVRGERESWYSNIVIFRPHPEWEQWLEPGSKPYPLEA